MTPELSEGNWVVELAELARAGKISAFARDQLTEIIHTGGRSGITMSEVDFRKLADEVFTIKFPETKKKFMLAYRVSRAYISKTEW